MFLFLGGEWVEEAATLEYGANVMTLWAKTFGGAMVDIQHRYYDGKNPPSKEGDTTGLQYLSSQQALADAAEVIAHLNREWARTKGSRDLKWIWVGGSYAGNMAAWLRLKYPNLSVGAFSISGPVEAVVDYTGFFGVEGHDLTPECLAFTRSAVTALEALVADQQKGWAQVQTDFGVTLTSALDAGKWGWSMGSDRRSRAASIHPRVSPHRLSPSPLPPLLSLCLSLPPSFCSWDLLGGGSICRQNRSTETPYQTLARTWKQEFGLSWNATYDANQVWRAYSWLWYYQTCTEMVGQLTQIPPSNVCPPSPRSPILSLTCRFLSVCVCPCAQGYYQTLAALLLSTAPLPPSRCSPPPSPAVPLTALSCCAVSQRHEL